jgi:hypothetical protein
MTALCTSLTGQVLMISKVDFLRMKNNDALWSQMKEYVRTKIHLYSNRIAKNLLVEKRISS